MKNLFKKISIVILSMMFAFSVAQATSLFTVQQGGTGVGTITGIIKGNGTSAFSAIVSGTDIKTINSTSLLGSGDITINSAVWGNITGTLSNQTDLQSALDAKQATLVSGTNIKTINSSSLLGSGNLAVGTVTSVSGTTNRITSTGGATPVLDISASYVGQSSITTLGTIGTGVWNGTLVAGTYGGTGVNNGAKTLTYLKNISLTSADDTGVYTLPTGTKTLVATDVSTLSSLASIGTITTGTWNGTKIGLAYGGTNADLSATGGTSQVLKQTSSGGAITVAQLAASDLSNGTTGSGAVALATSPSFTTPTLGSATASGLTLSGITGSTQCLHVNSSGVVSGIGSDCGSAGAGLSVGGTSISSGTDGRVLYDNAGTLGEMTTTGSGTVLALATSPSFTTPTLGVASATSINKVAITAPSSSATLTIADGKTLTVNNTLTLAGTDSTTMTFPSTSATIARTDAANTFTGHQTIEGVTTTGATGTGLLVFGTSPTLTTAVLGSSTATTQSSSDNSTKVATTAYVTTGISNAIAGVNPAVAVQYATTAAGDTSGLTYANGVSGVGATLTGVNNTVTAIDGHTFVVGDVGVTRILVKNDTQSPSGAFNGVYLFTSLHTAGTGDVFTRALDYNSSSDINNTGAIPVVSGTTNALTSWLLTSTVTTVGTDPLTYSKFTRSPLSVLTPDLGGTGIANNASSTLTISGSFGTTLTVSGTTSVTLPTSGTLANLAGAQAFTNKDLTGSGNTFPTFNQNTTGSAATLTTARAIYGNNFDGSADLTQIIASTYGGTGNGFAKFSGPSASEKTFTLPNASATILTSNAAVTVAQGGTGLGTLTAHGVLIGEGTSNVAITSAGTAGQILQSGGASADPAWSTPTFPSTSQTSGKVLVSDGTNFVASTPTFPNASATSGKFIRSDGTNWIASTPTLPTSAGSSGKLLQSDGTNYIETTPTYPNSATSNKILVGDGTNIVLSTPTFPNASATSGKVIKSDGTNWVASTETYAAPSTSGNVMTSDGTNWTSAASSSGIGACKNGTTTKNAADASTTQTIAHSLSASPKYVFIYAISPQVNFTKTKGEYYSQTSYDGSTQSSLSSYSASNSSDGTATIDTTFSINADSATGSGAQNRGVVTVDATNITITWTKSGNPTGTYTLLWTACK